MPYIYPNTEIALLKNIPLDASYEHTVTFASQAAQELYFRSNVFKYLSANSYQRAMNGSLRIECSMSEAVQCNYMFFKNSSFENKYFYAFITGWEYVNNVTTEITYEIDVFQTFFFDLNIQPSFVEREHSNTDIIGENLVPEGLEQGEYITMSTTRIAPTEITGTALSSACIILYCTFNDDTDCTDFTGDLINYCFTALNPIIKTTTADLNTFLTKVINKRGSLDGIVAAYMCPWTPLTTSASYITWNVEIAKGYTSFSGYVPRNNKLFTYPYYTIRIRNDVDANEYPFEFFTGNSANFQMHGTILPEPVLTLIPSNFKKDDSDNLRQLDRRMTIQNFPQIALSSDVYKVYLAQNAAALRASIKTNYIQKGYGIAQQVSSGRIGSAVGEAISLGSDIANTLAQLEDIKIRPPELNGTQTALNDYALGAKYFYIDHIAITSEFAKIIDDYFNMFGYATHEVKVPNITGRPHWNYVKTKGIVLNVANAPQPYVQKIQECLNRGITFWHNPSEVGNYSLDNRPV